MGKKVVQPTETEVKAIAKGVQNGWSHKPHGNGGKR